MTEGGQGSASLLGGRKIQAQIAGEHAEAQAEILVAVGEILTAPLDPTIIVHRARGRAADERGGVRMIAELPHGYFMTYAVHEEGLPPIGGCVVRVLSILQRVI